jgi:hypothetical protein
MPRRARRRGPVLAATAVIVAAAAGTTTVSLIRSAERRHERAAYLAYEAAALVPIREGGRIVQEEMKPSLSELRAGTISAVIAHERAAGWRGGMSAALTQLLALHPPAFLQDIGSKWKASLDTYVEIAALFDLAAAASGAERLRLLDEAAATGTRADRLFDAAARVMQLQRERLGLGVTPDLPNPAGSS